MARVDALWEAEGIVGEADGAGKYLGDFDLMGDRSPEAVARRVLAAGVRETRLRGLGLAVVRWDPAEITSDSYAVACRFRETRKTHDPGRVRARIRYDGSNTTTLYTPGR